MVQDDTDRSHTGDARVCFVELVRNVDLLAVMLNAEFEINYCNDYLLKLTGWSFDEIRGRQWTDVFVPASIEDLRPVWTSLWRNASSAWHHQNDILLRSGDRRTIRWHNMLLRDATGAVVAAGSIGEDISERIKLEHELLQISSRERGKIQRELHDELGQELFGLALRAQALAEEKRAGKEASVDELLRLSTEANVAIGVCRRIAYGLSPLSELAGGLNEALKRLTRLSHGPSMPDVSLEYSSDAIHLSASNLEDVYFIAQEAFTNAIRHAQASHIKIVLRSRADQLILQVIDDGIGLSDTQRRGLGWRTMLYRAARLGAQLQVSANPSGGTKVTLKCPR